MNQSSQDDHLRDDDDDPPKPISTRSSRVDKPDRIDTSLEVDDPVDDPFPPQPADVA